MSYAKPREIFSRRVRRMFNITKADWDVMLHTMKQTYSNQYKFARAKHKSDLKKLGVSERYFPYVGCMEDLGYSFDPFISTEKRLCFYYAGGETYFGSWRRVYMFVTIHHKETVK